jgi:hypothetical protein
MHSFQSRLLRRTAVALAAVAGLFISAAPQAATITLTGATGNSCSYSGMTVQPDGSFAVTCLTSNPQPGAPGSVSLSALGNVNSSTPVTATIFRTGGATGAAGVHYDVSGAGCTATAGDVSWADGDGAGKQVAIATTVSGSCTVNLSSATGAAMGSPSSVTFQVTAPVAGGGVNCPAGFTPPAELNSATLGGPGNVLLFMQKSGQTVSIPLPAAQAGLSTVQVAFGESAGGAYTPNPVTLEVSISKCRGFIDNNTSNRCNLRSTNGNYNSITSFRQAYSVIRDTASASLRGYCWAPGSDGDWYVNARWTYSNCAFGASTCGFAIQQNYGPY